MADTGRQTIISPEEIGPKSVFVINDIDLVVPPSQITVRKEDLVYRWRTLRTKSATKIPTGHGRVDVHATIYFPANQLLSMHRLLVQFRHSPFCYVDNRYLRETIVPDWPLHQNMAFTMTGIAITPMPGSSDTWVCELDLVWFNYFPYMHNWLYRQDWQTEWIYKSGDLDESQFSSYTIGWTLDLDTYERIHVPTPIEQVMTAYGSATFETNKRAGELDALSTGQAPDVLHDEWSIVQGGDRDKSKKTIFDMETAHAGVEWDLVPLPDNMMASPIVAQAKNSRIYVRYINYLQRDALFKNFGINVEEDLRALDAVAAQGRKWNIDAFFGLTGENGKPETYGLHTNRVARELRKRWISQMLDHNHGVKFTFHALKEIRFPQGWIDRSDAIKNEAIGNFAKRMGNIISRQQMLDNLGPPTGFTGASDLAIPIFRAPVPISSGFGQRERPTAQASSDHKGIDFAVPIGTPIVAPEDGTVESVKLLKDFPNNAGNRVHFRAVDGGKWSFFHLDSIPVQEGQFIARGSLIAISGNSAPPGVSTGPHLHLEYFPPGSGVQIDPTQKLENLLFENTAFVGPLQVPEEAPADPSQIEEEVARTELQTDLELTDEETDALTEMLTLLETEGWKYFDRDTSVLNIWEKLINLEIAHSGLDILQGGDAPEQFIQEGVVLTNVSGALTHIVANLPILSSEFPTQQHLGSIEPQYNFEFAVLDDRGDLEGISQMAQFLQGMRSLLQKNARTFRPVTDGWAVATDTFITRLFGTYTENDVREFTSGGITEDLDITKRTVIASSTAGTIEGNPGLSFIMLNVEETNPYETEVLTSTAPLLEDKEEARKEILGAIYNLDFIEKFKKVLLPTLVAQTAGGNTTRPGGEDYGKFHLDVYDPLSMDLALVRGLSSFVLEENGNQYLLLKKNQNELDYLLSGLTDEDGNPIQTESIHNELGAADNIQFAVNGTSGPIYSNGIDNLLSNEAKRNAVEFVGGDGDATYFKIPLTDAGLAGSIEGDEDWMALQESQRGFGLPGFAYEHYTQRVYFDISPTISDDPAVGLIPIERILDYWNGLREIIHTGNRMFAEELTGGTPNGRVVQELYCLPFKNRMWKSWQEYLKAFVQATPVFFSSPGLSWIPGIEPYDGKTAVEALQGIAGWPTPGTGAFYREKGDQRQTGSWPQPFDMNNMDDASQVVAIQTIANEYFGILGAPIGGLTSLDDKLFGYFKSTIGASVSGNIDVAAFWRDAHDTAIERLVNRYMRNMPIQISLPDFIKSKYNFLLGDLLGNFSDEENKVPALATMHEALTTNAASCGNITALSSTGNPWFQISNNDPFVIFRGQDSPTGLDGFFQDVRGTRGGAIGGLQVAAAPQTVAVDSFLKLVSGGRITSEDIISGTLEGIDNITGSELEELLYPQQQIGNAINSEFKYPVNSGEEDIKIRYIKSLLSTIADDLLQDPELLRAFGLEHLALADRQTAIQGTECYPDMDLPSHPYFGDTYQVYPDFYMWNIYSDGTALNPADQEKIYEQMDAVVQNCYNSMKQLEGGRKWEENNDKILGEPSVDDPIHLTTAMTPEGTDAQKDGSGPGVSAFEPSETARASIDSFNSKLAEELDKERAATYGTNVSKWAGGIKLSNAEGPYGAGAGVHYPSRGAPALYAKLQQDVMGIENMFGSQAGHANQYIDSNTATEIDGRIDGTNLEQPLEYTHTYDLNGLRKLARDSAKDLLSQKMTLRRAYPTFKLFFVEEDEFESRFLNFDDFYTYNAVKEFTVVQSRKLPADHAVITIQNVSGTLDGTKRNSIVDLDYYDKTAGDKLAAEVQQGSALSGDPVTQDTAQDQPFGAVVLRPGLNVQLRCGYANDPDNLHVMLSGRVVDVFWNKTGDLAEIMVQSFGTELIQAVKGTARDGNQASYKTTHELLGSMMLEPEVVHFGRWEFGQLFQIGESSDFRLDFTDYSREGFMGRFKVTNALTGWAVNHPWMILGIATGLTAINFLPIGRVFGSSKFAVGLLGKVGVATPLGKAGFTRALTVGATKGTIRGASSLSKGTQAIKIPNNVPLSSLANLADDALAPTYALALKKAGSESFEGVLRATMSGFRKKLAAAGSVDEIIEQSVKMERYLQGAIFKGQWMTKPWVSGIKGVGIWSAIGRKPLTKAFNIFLTGPAKVATAAVGAGLIADLVLKPILDPIYNNTVGKVRKFFARTQAHLFLSPQDDNLFPPHPKDYMRFRAEGIGGAFDEAIESALISGSRILFQTDDVGLFAFRLKNPDLFLSKKVDPQACTYEIVTSTIWQIFHEMSLRHPGWIYGPRPYGTKFRYTMFFGTPSQRYWARPASNRFIDRMNQLHRYLEGRTGKYGAPDRFTVSEEEFKALYGQTVFDDLNEKIEARLVRLANEAGFADLNPGGQAAAVDAIEFERIRILRRELTAVPLREYLRGLNLRFVPFRRYHLFTSERDIIWNGVMSSEQAVTNAVDVTYWSAADQDGKETQGNIQTAVFKAHAFIPEHQLRIAPVRWANCNTYQMAMRYGMGELLHRMRDMYRGEIVLLGNPRVRPWDIGILADSYNDMVGPVEVEQVVHTFSHETGFITEIKPSAVVFGNEISGWPMVEAMKMFAVAIKDIEDRYGGIKAEDPEDDEAPGVGFLGTLADLVNLWGARGADFNSFIDEKYQRIFGDEGASIEKIFGGNPPNTEAIDNEIDSQAAYLRDVAGSFGTGLTVVGGANALTGTVVGTTELLEALAQASTTPFANAEQKLGQTLSGGGKAFLKNPKALAAGAATITGLAMTAAGFGIMSAADKMDFPSLVWLIGGPLLFLHCLRNESIILVPLIKNGHPIVSGLAYNDPSMVWNNFRGEVNRWVDDTLSGTRDMLGLYQRYGSGIWNRLNRDDLADMTGEGIGTLPPAGGLPTGNIFGG